MKKEEFRAKLEELGANKEEVVGAVDVVPEEQHGIYLATINLLNEIAGYDKMFGEDKDRAIKLLTIFDAVVLTICDTIPTKERLALLDNIIGYYLKEEFDIDADNIIIGAIEKIQHRDIQVDKAYG